LCQTFLPCTERYIALVRFIKSVWFRLRCLGQDDQTACHFPDVTRACSGFWTACESGCGWPFVFVADKSMLWVLNRMWVRMWLALHACCWQEHALGFEQDVSQDLAGPSCLLLTRACSGFWTACESGSGWPFMLVADKSMLWVLNSMWVRIWLALPSCCWQEHALGFEQDVSQDLAGPSCLLLTRACSGFWTGCESGSGWPFLLVADKSMLWVLNSMWVRIWLALPACCWQDHALGFEQNVSQDLAGPLCLLLTRACSWFWTVCESGSGWPFLLVADKSMLWVLNRMWVRIWLALHACCWQGHALGFEQDVSQDLAGPSCLLLTRACSGFWTVCEAGSGWPFLCWQEHGLWFK